MKEVSVTELAVFVQNSVISNSLRVDWTIIDNRVFIICHLYGAVSGCSSFPGYIRVSLGSEKSIGKGSGFASTLQGFIFNFSVGGAPPLRGGGSSP